MNDFNDPQTLEKYSSAVSLSDMEIFIFPELMYSLVLANIMSPITWEWRKDSWFKKMNKLNEYRRLLRAKQFIMDKFTFNLDLDTWGLTTKEKEMDRFKDFVDEKILRSSNALFGYEGDKYYFDMDIRKHFGLDKYNSNIIPYWKTETLEAMEAFKFKEGYPSGAGECVSLATLYAAALFTLAKVPLEKIYLFATPLHSQNFIDVKDGIVTNNRRIVTKNMWFNGTELSAKARRALENEKVTMIAHSSGYIHTVFDNPTIDKDVYESFKGSLQSYLKTDINYGVLANFLRDYSKIQRCFQIEHSRFGKNYYIEAERVFGYEHSSKARVGDDTQEKLLEEIEIDDFYSDPLENRISLNELEAFFSTEKISIDSEELIPKLKESLHHTCYDVESVVKRLVSFCKIVPNLPSTDKKFSKLSPISLDPEMDREEIIDVLQSMRSEHPVVDLAFYAYRDLNNTDWRPFLKAAFERNPVTIEFFKDYSNINDIYQILNNFENESIYDGTRLAQPDEVINFKRGDGIEKTITLINVLKERSLPYSIESKEGEHLVQFDNNKFVFLSDKKLTLPKEV